MRPPLGKFAINTPLASLVKMQNSAGAGGYG